MTEQEFLTKYKNLIYQKARYALNNDVKMAGQSSMTEDDITQEVYIKLLSCIRKGSLDLNRSDKELYNYVYSTIKTVICNINRSLNTNKRRHESDPYLECDTIESSKESSEDSMEQKLITNEFIDRIHKANIEKSERMRKNSGWRYRKYCIISRFLLRNNEYSWGSTKETKKYLNLLKCNRNVLGHYAQQYLDVSRELLEREDFYA